MHIMAPKGHDMYTLTCILGRKPRGTGVLLLLLLILLLLLLRLLLLLLLFPLLPLLQLQL